MKRRNRFVPSSGFVLLMISYSLLISFLAWGSSKPELDRAWLILQRMQREQFSGLAASESRILQTLLQRDPRFAHALIGRSPLGFVEPTDDGWVSLPRSHLIVQAPPAAGLGFTIESAGEVRAYPLSVTLEMQKVRKTLTFGESGQKTLEWSHAMPVTPAWIEVSVDSEQTGSRVSARPRIRVRLATPEPNEVKP